ncbi:MAG: hypothetical protein Q7R49_04895 [Candidatus Daviesbacteria bacterium]|nr:hypothetical protein [Candidatus Daviesbacteria bacterium]
MDIEEEIKSIHQRNSRVEADKAWEGSTTRKIIVALLTYCVITLFFYIANFPNPMVSAIVPTLGFILSTLSLGFFKDFWIKNIYKKINS